MLRGSLCFTNGGGCAHRCLQERTGVKSVPPSMLAINKTASRRRPVWIIYACAKGRLCRSFCLQLRGAAPPPPNQGCADHFVCNWGGLHPPQPPCFCAPPQPPRFLKAIEAAKKEQASGFMVALKKGSADRFVCNWGGCAPPTPPLFKRPSMAAKKKNKRQHLFLR